MTNNSNSTQKLARDTNNRLLIFIVAYNAESTIENVLSRIPHSLGDEYEVEILIIDDSSKDETFKRAELAKHKNITPFKITVLFNPDNQGYGGNQKIGYHYAIENKFNVVALLHGDGQYAPECLPVLAAHILKGQADAVFGSRMLGGTSALKGGMPFYKFIGNKVLTWFQNKILGTNLSEFHSGYRVYSVRALRQIPFQLNNNGFHFDTEIIIQLVKAKMHIKEIPIPTFYGDEICYVNGLLYAWNIFLVTMLAWLQKYNITYSRRFDCIPAREQKQISDLKMRPVELVIVKHLDPGSRVFVSGTVRPSFKKMLNEHNHQIVNDESGELMKLIESNRVDCIVIFNDSGLLSDQKGLLECLRSLCLYSPAIKIVLHTGNAGYLMTRLRLFFGRFSYSPKGLIDQLDLQLVTLRSANQLFMQNGFIVNSIIGLVFPYKIVFSNKFIINGFTLLSNIMISIRKSLFSYQFLFIFSAEPSLEYLLNSAFEISGRKKEEINREI